MKGLIFLVLGLIILGGCAKKGFDHESYERQNRAAEKSHKSL
jgi:hypothetical protein